MSALGQKLPRRGQSGVSALPPKAAATVADQRVRFGPQADLPSAPDGLRSTSLTPILRRGIVRRHSGGCWDMIVPGKVLKLRGASP
jgi:hypothetical protein